METATEICFFHKGAEQKLSGISPSTSILDYLRDIYGFTGTKEGCNEGDCGACTVALASLDHNNKITFKAINACVSLIHTLNGKWLITVENVAGPDGELHPVQDEMVKAHASQCGFCTPGFVMSLFAAHMQQDAVTRNELSVLLGGNLCRCTGYGPIADAAVTAFKADIPHWMTEQMSVAKDWLLQQSPDDLFFEADDITLLAPVTLDKFADYYAKNQDAQIIAGTSDVGLWLTKDLTHLPHFLVSSSVVELNEITVTDDAFFIGSAVSHTDAWQAIRADFPEAQDWFDRFASVQIRNTGTLGGNVANASPIGDSPPLLMALGATLILQKEQATRALPIADYFLSYGRQDRQDGEFIAKIVIPRRDQSRKLVVHKNSRRIAQDISTLLMAASWGDEAGRITDPRIAFGGMAAIPKFAHATMNYLGSAPLNALDPHMAVEKLHQDFQPISDHRASATYRMSVAENLLISAFWGEDIALAFISEASQ